MRNLAIAVISLHFASWGWAGAEYRSHPRSPLGEFRAGARASPNPPEAPSSTHLPANALKPETVRAAAEKALAELGELVTAENFRHIIARALQLHGSYYLTYHHWATRQQTEDQCAGRQVLDPSAREGLSLSEVHIKGGD